MTKKLTMGSFFAGVGGFDAGAERNNIEVKWAVEWDAKCHLILRRHFPDTKLFGDINKVEVEDLEPVDIITWGFPCTDVSHAGKRKGLVDEEGNVTRSGLFYRASELIRGLRPRTAIFENVPGLITSNRGADFARVLLQMADIGYGPTTWVTLDSQHFGVAQRRRRVFGFSSRNSEPDIAEGCAAEILAIESRLRGNPAARRKAWQEASSPTGTSPSIGVGPEGTPSCQSNSSGARGGDGGVGGRGLGVVDDGGVIPIHDQATRFTGKRGDKTDGKGNGIGVGEEGDPMFTLTSGDKHATAIPLDLRNASRTTDPSEMNRQGLGVGEDGDPAPTLTNLFVPGVAANTFRETGFRKWVKDDKAGTLRQRDYKESSTLVAKDTFGIQDDETIAVNIQPTLTTPSSSGGGHPAAVAHPTEPVAFDPTQMTHPANHSSPKSGDPCHPLTSQGYPPHVAFPEVVTARESGQGYWMEDDKAGTLRVDGDKHSAAIISQPIADKGATVKSGKPKRAQIAMNIYGANKRKDRPAGGMYVKEEEISKTVDSVSNPSCAQGGTAIITARESGQGYWMEDNKAGTLRAEGENRPSRPSNVIAFSCKDSGQDASEGISPTLRSMNNANSNLNGGGQMAVVLPEDQKPVSFVVGAHKGWAPQDVSTNIDQSLTLEATNIHGVATSKGVDLRNGQVTGDVAMPVQAGGMGDDRGMCINSVPHVLQSDSTKATWWDGGDVAQSMTTRCHDQFMPDKANFAAVLQPVAVDARNLRIGPDEVSGTLQAKSTGGQSLNYTNPVMVPTDQKLYSIMPMNSGKDFKAREVDICQPIMTTPVGGNQGGDIVVETPMGFLPNRGADCSPTENGSPTVTGSHAGQPAVAYGCDLSQKAEGIGFTEEVAPCVASGTHPDHGSHVLHGATDTVAFADTAQTVTAGMYYDYNDEKKAGSHLVGQIPEEGAAFKPCHYTRGKDGAPSDITPPLMADSEKGDQEAVVCAPSIGFRPNNSAQARSLGEAEEMAPTIPSEEGGNKACVSSGMVVRRLTPEECERLQGFQWQLPDGSWSEAWTDWGVDEKGKKVIIADSSRYKQMGNAVTVNVAEWLLRVAVKVLADVDAERALKNKA